MPVTNMASTRGSGSGGHHPHHHHHQQQQYQHQQGHKQPRPSHDAHTNPNGSTAPAPQTSASGGNGGKDGQPQMQQRTQCRLFVGNIAGSVTTEDLREVLEKYGEVTDLYFNKEKFYAFVKYAVSGAERAQQELHGMMLKGRHLNVHDGAAHCALFVGDLPRFVTNKQLWDAFSAFGDLERAVVAGSDRYQSLGWGIVEFKTKQRATQFLARCEQGALLVIGRTPCPVRIEPWKEADTVVGVRQVSDYMAKEYMQDMEAPSRLLMPGSGQDYELAAKWDALRLDQKRRKAELEEVFEQERAALSGEIRRQLEEVRQQEELRALQEREMQLRKEADMMRQAMNMMMAGGMGGNVGPMQGSNMGQGYMGGNGAQGAGMGGMGVGQMQGQPMGGAMRGQLPPSGAQQQQQQQMPPMPPGVGVAVAGANRGNMMPVPMVKPPTTVAMGGGGGAGQAMMGPPVAHQQAVAMGAMGVSMPAMPHQPQYMPQQQQQAFNMMPNDIHGGPSPNLMMRTQPGTFPPPTQLQSPNELRGQSSRYRPYTVNNGRGPQGGGGMNQRQGGF